MMSGPRTRTQRLQVAGLACLLVTAFATAPAPAAGTEAEASEQWDLLFYSDSLGWFVAEKWAERIEDELGIDVVVHDFARGDLKAVEIDDWLAPGGKHHELLAEAEIISIFGNPRGSGTVADSETCVSNSTTSREPPAAYTKADWAGYQDVMRSIYDSVFEARAGQPTIVRAMDFALPVVAEWKEAGIYTECLRELSLMNEVIAETAAEYDVPVVSAFAAFNGPDHDEDPKEKGWIGSDRIHPSAEGQDAIVEAFHAVGYEPLP